MVYNTTVKTGKASGAVYRDLNMVKGYSISESPSEVLTGDSDKSSKYQDIVAYFKEAIAQGKYKAGERLPSESEIVRQFKLSRPTVSRAMREMKMAGLVERHAGSGSFVKKPGVPKPLTLGLLIPNLADMEIFDGICGQISREAQNRGCDLLWARFFPDKDPQFAEKACEPYLRKPVDGVFFAPLEFSRGMEQINTCIAQTLDNANIPVVLLDRDITPFPQRSKHDLVGIDNFAAGYLLGSHMIACGCKSIVFIAHPFSAGTVDARATGVLRAHLSANHPLLPGWYEQIDPIESAQVQALLKKSNPDAIICANDKTAGELMQTLHRLKVKVPDSISVAGVDDVRFSRLLHPALTTVHQPLEMIGTVTLQAMMDRLANPQLPPRHIMLDAELVVRQSTRSRPDSPGKHG